MSLFSQLAFFYLVFIMTFWSASAVSMTPDFCSLVLADILYCHNGWLANGWLRKAKWKKKSSETSTYHRKSHFIYLKIFQRTFCTLYFTFTYSLIPQDGKTLNAWVTLSYSTFLLWSWMILQTISASFPSME